MRRLINYLMQATIKAAWLYGGSLTGYKNMAQLDALSTDWPCEEHDRDLLIRGLADRNNDEHNGRMN